MKGNLCSGLAVLLLIAAPAFALEKNHWGTGSTLSPTNTKSATVSHRLTLEAAVALAMEDNPQLRGAGSAIDAAMGRAWQFGRWSNPSLDLNVEEWPVNNGGNFSDAKQTIGVSQTLPWPGKKRYDRRAGAAQIRLSESELAMRRTRVARDVKAAFHRVIAAEASLKVGEDLLTIAGASTDATQKRVAAGAAPYQEQLRAEIQLERVRNEVATLQINVTNARESLFTLIGRPDLLPTPVSGTLSDFCRQELSKAQLDQWQPQHPDVLTAEATLNAAELEARRANLDPYPDITASVAGGRLGETDQSIIEFGLSVPLPLLDSSRGRKSEAAATVRMAMSQLDAVRLQLTLDWSHALQRYQTAGEQVAAYREQILPKSEEALRLVQTGFEEGRLEFIDLLDTQRIFAESRLAYQQRLLELNIAEADLEAMLHPATLTTSAQLNP